MRSQIWRACDKAAVWMAEGVCVEDSGVAVYGGSEEGEEAGEEEGEERESKSKSKRIGIGWRDQKEYVK